MSKWSVDVKTRIEIARKFQKGNSVKQKKEPVLPILKYFLDYNHCYGIIHGNQTSWNTNKRRCTQTLRWHTKPHTLTLSFSQGCVILWCYFSQKAFPQAHQSLCIWVLNEIQNTRLKYENHVHHCDTLLSFKPTTGGLYSCLLFCSLLCCRCRCHHNRWVFNVCLKLNVWPTHVFPNKQDTWKYSKHILCAGGWMRPLGLHTQNIFCIRI